MILAVTHAGDEHAPLVLAELARLGAAVELLDLAELPRHGTVALDYGAPGDRLISLPGGRVLRGADVSAVWWRRPRPFTPPAGVRAEHAGFAVRQTSEAVMGLVASLHARFVNDPWREEQAGHKTLQLAAAEDAGLAVPRTCVTSDPAEARRFLARLGPASVVHKPLHGPSGPWRPTRGLTEADRARLDAIRLAPAIFQERIPGVDVRVTVVGEALFAAEIDARRTATPDDFRPSFGACPVSACTLPAATEAALRRLLARLGLVYAACDFRRREDGELVFLEVNPAGQWFFVEQRTGQPITQALAAELARAA